jgi:hypothetical protein
VNNLFDEEFNYQEVDFRNPRFLPERTLFLKFTVDVSR